MNTCFQLAAYARSQWALAGLLATSSGACHLAEIAFQRAKDAAWAYGWGASDEPHSLFTDVPELMHAFQQGQDVLKQDMKLTS